MKTLKVALAATCVAVVGLAFTASATCTYTGSWDVAPTSAEDEIVIESGTLTWDATLPQTVASWTQNGGTVTFKTGRSDDTRTVGVEEGDERVFKVTGDVTINGGTVTHAVQPSMSDTSVGWIDGKGVYRLIMDIGGNLVVAEGAKISATGMGFLSGQKGPGACNRGGCHGGSGGDNSQDSGNSLVNKGKMYGSVKAPKTIGSTGSGSMNGGGSIQLTVAKNTVLNGALEANGASGTWYGAAGGSVHLVTKALTGMAGSVIAARGSGSSCCGSGGRISVVLTGANEDFSGFAGDISAQPLYYFTGSNGNRVHPGTIYIETAADGGKGILLVKGMGNSVEIWGRGTSLEMAGDDCDFSKIVLTNGAHLVVCSNVTVRTEAIEAYGTAGHSIAVAGGTLVVPDDYVFTNHQLRCFANGSVISPKTEGASVGIARGVTFTDDGEVTVPGDLTLLSGATVTHTGPNNSDPGYRVHIVCTNLTVESGAKIDVNGKGYDAAKGEGRPTDALPSRGGSHGGLGADVGEAKCYGSIVNPNTYGSGGQGRAGGGAIRIVVRKTLDNNGSITARGETAAPWGMVGAGGSVYISAGKLTGAAGTVITADAGTGDKDYGSGGGRVAVSLTGTGSSFADYPGKITAYGGGYRVDGVSLRKYSGGPGTVYLRKPGEGEHDGTLIIDNGPLSTDYSTTDISPTVTDAEVGNVILTNRAVLRVRQNSSLVVRGDFINAAREQNYVCGELGDADNAAGQVVFTDASRVSTVAGTNNFPALVCTTPDKEIRFGTEKTLTRVSGLFSIAGADGQPVSLNPAVYECHWLLEMLDGAKATVSYANVAWSDAEGGNQVVADETSTVDENSKNWLVSQPVRPGDPIRWTGALSSVWSTPGNWDPVRSPLDTDVVTIGGDAAYMPLLTENMTFNRLIIENGAFFDLCGYSLTITNGLVASGILTANGGETLTVAKEAQFASVVGSLSLTLAGEDVTFVPNGNRFASVVFGNGGDVAVNGSFRADRLVCRREESAAVRFAPGAVVTTAEADIVGIGPGDVSVLTLACMDSDGRWSLDVSGKASVRGVIVSEAQAGGLKIHAELPSVDNGNNSSDWIFGETYAAWQGPSGGDWNEPANWSGGAVPDSLARVVFDAEATVALTNAVRVRELNVSAAVKLAGAGGKLTTSDTLEVLSGGTLTADVPLESEGTCYVRNGGTLTHSANPGATDTGVKLDLTVRGDMVVEFGGSVLATGKGFAPTRGPGLTDGLWGSAHGGALFPGSAKRAYGSVFNPDTLGSGGTEEASDKRGGGRIRMSIAGTLTVNGTIAADGFLSSNYYVGSGGSVCITCGALSGTGTVSADGARSYAGGYGAGGRVAVYQTVATDFAGGVTVRATSGWGFTAGAKPNEHGCGTVYLQSAGDETDAGLCVLSQQGGDSDGRGYNPAGAELPAQNGDDVRRFRATNFKVTEGGALSLSDDLTINDLILESTGTLRLNGHTLTILSRTHKNGKGWPSNWQSLVSKGADAAGNPGQIVWAPRPLCLILR